MSDSLRPHELQHARPPCPHQLLEFTQTHIHRVSDDSQPSHPLSSPSPPAPIPPSIRVFSNESTLHMRWPKYKASILRLSAFFIVQLSHPYMTTGETIALTRWTFVGKVMSLLFNMLFRLVMAFLSRSKPLLISWLQSPSAVILEPQKIVWYCFPIYFPWSDGTRCHDLSFPWGITSHQSEWPSSKKSADSKC